MVPEYEEREAALFGLFNWTQWSALLHEERVQGVAHYRLHNLIDGHLRAIGERRGQQAALAARRPR